MAELKEYTVVIGGVEHVLQLTAEDAKARGVTSDATSNATEEKAAPAPQNKARTAADKK